MAPSVTEQEQRRRCLTDPSGVKEPLSIQFTTAGSDLPSFSDTHLAVDAMSPATRGKHVSVAQTDP
jgi:hypothetical protein